jgi:hypothetical protein
LVKVWKVDNSGVLVTGKEGTAGTQASPTFQFEWDPTNGHDHSGLTKGKAVAHGSLSGVTANQHHNQVHLLNGADHSDVVATTTKIVRLIPTMRIGASGGLLNVNVLAYTSVSYFDIPFNKADWVFSPFTTKSIKIKVRGKVQNAAQTCDVTVFQANDQKAAFAEIVGAGVQFNGGTTTNWQVLTGANFWANVNAGDTILRIYAKSSTTTPAQCGQLDTSDELFLIVEEVA